MSISGIHAAVTGSNAKPATVAAGSKRPSRSRNGGDDGNRAVDHGGVARVVVVADRQSDVIERGHRVTVCGFESGKSLRQG